jgi:hypothetical protein
VTPSEGWWPGTMWTPQIGRRIVIPRSRFPIIEYRDADVACTTFPTINVKMRASA